MSALSITDAWNETAAFMRREARLVLPVGFMLIALPGAIVQAATPATQPNQLPEPGMWLALIPFALIATLIGNLAISVLALRPGVSVAEAIQQGARRFLPVLGAALLIGLGSMIALLPVVLVAAGLAVALGIAALAAIPALLVIPLLIFLWTRMLLANPIGAVETGGPVAILKRSWALTAGRFWQLLGFLILLMIAAMVASGAVGAVGGTLITLAFGPIRPDNLSFYLTLILATLVQTILASLFAVMVARIYAQLVPSDRSPVFS
jgi:hypothetical protein